MIEKKKVPFLNFIPLLIIAFILYKVVNKVDLFLFINNNIVSILSPFIWGFGIAYLLNPLMKTIERNFKIKRGWAILIIYFLVLGIITIFITVISPSVANSLGELADSLPRYIEETEIWIKNQAADLELIDRYNILPYIEENIEELIRKTSIYINDMLTAVLYKAIDITSTFFKIILSMIISVYFLKDKERFIRSLKKVIFAFLNKEKAKGLIDFGVELDQLFSQFIIGKFIDSCIIGVICFVGLFLIKAPYILLLSLIVGITNMIPYFGPFIGGVPVVLITLFHDPIKALWAVVFIIALQQFDGLYLGPKILGDKVGLSPFWIILAIIIGGGIFGVIGMFLAVPIMAVIKAVLERYINKKLESQNIRL